MQSFKCCPPCPRSSSSPQLGSQAVFIFVTSHHTQSWRKRWGPKKQSALIMQDSLTRWRAFSSADERVGHDSRGYTTGACVIITGIYLLLFGADIQWRERCRRPTAALLECAGDEDPLSQHWTKCPSASNESWLRSIWRCRWRSRNEWNHVPHTVNVT